MTFDWWALVVRPVAVTAVFLLAVWDTARDKKPKSKGGTA